MKSYIKDCFRAIILYFYAAFFPEEYYIFLNKEASIKQNKQWRKENQHNFTNIANDISEVPFPIASVTVGKNTYGNLKVFSYGSTDEKLTIGSYCSIAPNVKFIMGGMHHLNHLSTFPFKAYYKNEIDTFSKGPIIVEDDVWIGTDSIILSGVTLTRGTVVAAGSVVSKSTVPYSVVGGNPAKLIKYRFEESLINKLLLIDFNKINKQFINNNIDLLSQEIELETIEYIDSLVNNR